MKKDNERTEVKKRPERKRFLNVIYFIDSNRTRTLKFSIGTSYLTVGLLSAAVVWSFVATTMLIRDHFVIEKMRSHTTSLLETVFNYQTRYDEVYEKAYPSNDSSLLTAEKDKRNSDTKAVATEQTVPAKADETPTPKEKAVSQPQTAMEPPLAIDNFSTLLNDKNLMVRLSLKNLNSSAKASGSVRAVAKFVDADNKPFTLESHPNRTRDDNGNDEHFNIRYFKNKAMYFEPPSDSGGRYLEVTVTIKDDEGRSKDFTYPLNKDVPARAPLAAKPKLVKVVPVHAEPEKEIATHTDSIAPVEASSATSAPSASAPPPASAPAPVVPAVPESSESEESAADSSN